MKTVDEKPNNRDSATEVKAMVIKSSPNRVVYKDGNVMFERGSTSVE